MNAIEEKELLGALSEFNALGIREQIDYNKYHIYSIITHSTAIEGSTISAIENQLLFDEGIVASGKSITEQMMNLDLKEAYDHCICLAKTKYSVTPSLLRELASLVLRRTGGVYNTPMGSFDASKGDFRLVNVTAGFGGKSYMNYTKIENKINDFCAWLNSERDKGDLSVLEKYRLSFLAHLRLVSIHPWVDGNGRTSRLLMNLIQMENDLLPSIVRKEKKSEYIAALVKSREEENEDLFCDFMFKELAEFIRNTIKEYKHSIELDDKEETQNKSKGRRR